jgi:translation elongation factor EF-Tu-like GTPase
MTVDDVFAIRGRGLVATGMVEYGSVRVGDEVWIDGGAAVRVDGIEAFRKKLDEAVAGDNVGLLFAGLDKGDVQRGSIVAGGHTAPAAPAPAMDRAGLLAMRDAGLMTDEQVEEALRARR